MTELSTGRDAAVSRRRFLRAAGVTGATAAVGGAGVAAGQAVAETYEFGGEVSGWQGRSPASIEGQTNPTLNLQAGETYEFVWENLDGAPHDFTLRDDSESVVEQTDTVSEQGGTASMTVSVPESVANYVCTIHPNTMLGNVAFGEVRAAAPNTPFGLPWAAVMVGGFVVLGVLSPIAFAVLLYTKYRPQSDRPPEGERV
jgi:plastocyanin